MFLVAKILHVVGNVLWLGGGVVAAFAMAALLREAPSTRVAAAKVLRDLILKVVTPAMGLSLVSGLYMLLSFWSELYAKAPWMHAKLTVGLIAAGFSGVLSGRVRRIAAGAELSPGALRAAGAVLLLSAVANVAFVMIRFGSH